MSVAFWRTSVERPIVCFVRPFLDAPQDDLDHNDHDHDNYSDHHHNYNVNEDSAIFV